jgi:hypothetical protein
MTHKQFLKLIRNEIVFHGSLRAAARDLGVSPGYISDTLSGKRSGGKIADAMGYDVITEVRYIKRCVEKEKANA